MTFFGDLIFSLGALALAGYLFWRANALEFRFYIVWGSLLGLFVYLKVFSRLITRILFKLLSLLEKTVALFVRSLKVPYRGLVLLMGPPYAILRWMSLLLYRIAEVLVADPLSRARYKTARLKFKLARIWNYFFPPRTNG